MVRKGRVTDFRKVLLRIKVRERTAKKILGAHRSALGRTYTRLKNGFGLTPKEIEFLKEEVQSSGYDSRGQLKFKVKSPEAIKLIKEKTKGKEQFFELLAAVFGRSRAIAQEKDWQKHIENIR